MAVKASIATGNFTDAGTWGTVDATSYLNAENATESLLTTAYSGTRSSAFTPGAITISHIGVKLCERIGTTGTISVNLELDSDNSQVAGTEVTIDVADLPSATEANFAGGWIFFKLATPVLLLAATAYQVAAKTSSATQVDLWCNGTADNLSRALITTTTAAPGAGDDLIVAGEKTGAGTGNNFVVTMNNTATTDFGSAPTHANSLITPGISICSGGTLQYGTTAATAYYLKVSNSVVVYSGGTLNIGTTGTPIPRNSTAVLEFDPGADGDYGLIVRHLGTFNSQGLSRTVSKNVIACKLNTDEAANSTSLGVNTDTGWLDNDEIVVASTTRTATQTEKGTLNGNANASDMTVDGFAGTGGGLLNAHSGTSPTQAEVVLLTRNIKIRSATSTIMAFIAIAPYAGDAPAVDIDWTEFYYLGENTNGYQFGITIGWSGGAFSGSFDMQYSSLHDFEDWGFRSTNASGNNINVSNNVFYNLNTAAASSTNSVLTIATTQSNTISGNYFLACSCASNGNVILLSDIGLTFTNNVIAGSGNGSSSYAVSIAEASATTGTMTGNTIHSMAGNGITIGAASMVVNLGTTTVYRNTGQGLITNATIERLVFTGASFFGNTSTNIVWQNPIGLFAIYTSTITSDASFTTGIGVNAASHGFLYIVDSTFGSTSTHTSADVNIQSTVVAQITAINSTFSSTELSGQTTMMRAAFLRSHKNDASATTFKVYQRHGTILNDTTIRHTASGYSWKLTPNNATGKLALPGPLEFDTFKVAVNASSLVTITGYVYKDATYNGNAPRLVVVGGIVGGVGSIGTNDTDSLTVAHSNWEQLSVAVTPNEAGVIEYYFDCDGTAGNVYVDDIAVTQA